MKSQLGSKLGKSAANARHPRALLLLPKVDYRSIAGRQHKTSRLPWYLALGYFIFQVLFKVSPLGKVVFTCQQTPLL